MDNSKRDTEHNHAQSLAFLNAKAAVTNYEVPTHPQHVSQNPSDLQNIVEAQIVTKNKDNYNEQEEQPNELISGPPKKYIDNPQSNENEQKQSQQQSQVIPLSNFAHSAMQQINDKSQGYDSFFSGDSNQTQQQQQQNNAIMQDTNQKAQSNTEDIFGGMMEQTNANNEQQQQQNRNDDDDDKENEEEEEEEEQKQTFLRFCPYF